MTEPGTASPPTALEGSPRSRPADLGKLTRGTFVGRYVVLDQLGEGGMGVVYAAYDPELNRRVALKLLTTNDQARMVREAQALARLSHPNVVAVYDVGSVEDRVFVAMELVEGETLSAWLRAGKRPWREVVAMFLAAGRGLAAAHAAGLVHRDFKPANVLIGTDGRVRVVDFGLARAAGVSPSAEEATPRPTGALADNLTQTGSVVGTPLYMPPEAHRGELVAEAGDEFSFCVALHEALYGERPFEQIAGDALPALRAEPDGSDVPSWLRRIVVRGLAFAPADRFASMDALLAALADDPGARRRRVFAIGGALVVAAGAIALVARLGPSARDDDPCQHVPSPPWNAVARARVAGAFAASGAHDAANSFAYAASALDATTSAWLGARAGACAATREQKTQPEAQLLLRLACLDRQRDDLDALIELFTHANAKVVSRGAQAVRSLSQPAVCAQARSLSFVEPPSVLNRERVGELRHRLAQARALEVTGNEAGATEAARRVLTDAQPLAYKPLIAETLFQIGRSDRENVPGAIGVLGQAETTAIACGLDDIASRAAATRFLRAAQIGKQDPELQQAARAWVDRVNDLDAIHALEEGLAATDLGAGRDASAIEHFERARSAASEVSGETSMAVLGIETSEALAMVQAGRYAQAADLLAGAIANWERTYGPRSLALAGPLDNYGFALAAAGRFAEASQAWRRALALPDASPPMKAFLRADLARGLLGEGKTAEALAEAEAGVGKLHEFHIEGLNLAFNMDPLAAAYVEAKRYNDALASSRECLAVFAKIGNATVDTVPCLGAEGAALLGLKKPADALDPLERALALQAKHPARAGVLGTLQFTLARALVASGGDRTRAAELARTARVELARYPFAKHTVDELDAWQRDAKLP